MVHLIPTYGTVHGAKKVRYGVPLFLPQLIPRLPILGPSLHTGTGVGRYPVTNLKLEPLA